MLWRDGGCGQAGVLEDSDITGLLPNVDSGSKKTREYKKRHGHIARTTGGKEGMLMPHTMESPHIVDAVLATVIRRDISFRCDRWTAVSKIVNPAMLIRNRAVTRAGRGSTHFFVPVLTLIFSQDELEYPGRTTSTRAAGLECQYIYDCHFICSQT